MSPDKLVYMANQIGKFFASQGQEQARGRGRPITSRSSGTRICARQSSAHLEAGGAGLGPGRASRRRAIEETHKRRNLRSRESNSAMTRQQWGATP